MNPAARKTLPEKSSTSLSAAAGPVLTSSPPVAAKLVAKSIAAALVAGATGRESLISIVTRCIEAVKPVMPISATLPVALRAKKLWTCADARSAASGVISASANSTSVTESPSAPAFVAGPLTPKNAVPCEAPIFSTVAVPVAPPSSVTGTGSPCSNAKSPLTWTKLSIASVTEPAARRTRPAKSRSTDEDGPVATVSFPPGSRVKSIAAAVPLAVLTSIESEPASVKFGIPTSAAEPLPLNAV